MTSWNVPWRFGSGDAERGKSSYQAGNERAAGSTTTESGCSSVVSCVRSGYVSTIASSSSPSACSVVSRFAAWLSACCVRLGVRRRLPARAAAATMAAADLEIDGHVLFGVDALLEVVPPRLPRVDPGADRVLVATDLRQRERRPPAVVAERLHLDLVPSRSAVEAIFLAPAQHDADLVVAVGERVCLDREHVTDDALHGESPAVDLAG